MFTVCVEGWVSFEYMRNVMFLLFFVIYYFLEWCHFDTTKYNKIILVAHKQKLDRKNQKYIISLEK